MPPEKTTTAEISETGEGTFAVAIKVSGYTLKGDEPKESGGNNLGPAPYDLLTAALGECTAMTVRWYAQKQNWPLEHVAVTVTHRKTLATNLPESGLPAGASVKGNLIDLFEKTVAIKGDRLTPEQKQKLLEVAAKCPVQRTLEGSPVIRTGT